MSGQNMGRSICCQTLKRRMDISDPLNFQQFTVYTDRIIVAVNFLIKRENLRLKSKKRENTVDIRRFSMINLVEKSRVQSVILRPNAGNRHENGRFEAVKMNVSAEIKKI